MKNTWQEAVGIEKKLTSSEQLQWGRQDLNSRIPHHSDVYISPLLHRESESNELVNEEGGLGPDFGHLDVWSIRLQAWQAQRDQCPTLHPVDKLGVTTRYVSPSHACIAM